MKELLKGSFLKQLTLYDWPMPAV